ncbi:MAG: hypothetical protein ACTSU2_09215 [Promethearchaeota archaeon]
MPQTNLKTDKNNNGDNKNNLNKNNPKIKIEKISQIPGIGKKLRDKLIDYFSDEQNAINALRNGMGGIVPGISQNKAIAIARSIFELEHNTSITKILKTQNIREIYEDVKDYISEYFITDYSKNKISLFFPLDINNLDLIRERYETFSRAIKFVKKYHDQLEREHLTKNLEKVSLFKKGVNLKKIKNRCILTDSRKVMDFLSQNQIDNYIACEMIDLKKSKDKSSGRARGMGAINGYGLDRGSGMPGISNIPGLGGMSGLNGVGPNPQIDPSLIDGEIDPEVAQMMGLDAELYSGPNMAFKKYTDSFETVIFISDNVSSYPDLKNIICYKTSEINFEKLFPEKIITEFAANKRIIKAIHNIAQALNNTKDDHLIDEFTKDFDFELLENLQQNIDILDDRGKIKKGFDPQYDTLNEDADNFSNIIAEIEAWINDKIKNEVEKNTFTLKGDKMLDFYRSNVSMEMIREYLPNEIDYIISDIVEQGIAKIDSALHLKKNEKSWTEKLFPEVIEYPISLNPQGLDELEFNINIRASMYNYNLLKKIAEQLNSTKGYIDKIIWNIFEFEFFYAIGRFANDYKLNIPLLIDKIGTGKDAIHGIYLQDSYNLQLMNATLKKGDKTVPISYLVGDPITSLKENPEYAQDLFRNMSFLRDENITLENIKIPQDIKISRLNLLTGSNSGGKTMCLYTIAHNLILAQMGLPCAGIVIFHPFSEMYFFKKSSGQVSAGAFESTLLMFVDLAKSDREKIIMADELEAITEPNAAAKVLGGFFSILLENQKNYAIFVTHLVELLIENMDEDKKDLIRIDGIEARGLNDKLELIVDRSPRFNYIAKSTPEFILERLSKTGDPDNRKIFKDILDRFKRN